MNKRMQSNLIKVCITLIFLLGMLFSPLSVHKDLAGTVSAMNSISRPNIYCSESGCNGYYPAYWGCDSDPITVSSRYILIPSNVGIHELRYSNNCSSFWSRTTLTLSSYYIGATLDRKDLTPDYGTSSGAPLSAGLSVHTLMSSSKQSCRTCGNASLSPVPNPTYVNCGVWFTQ